MNSKHLSPNFDPITQYAQRYYQNLLDVAVHNIIWYQDHQEQVDQKAKENTSFIGRYRSLSDAK